MGKRIAFAVCGSFCTIGRALECARRLAASGYTLVPILSETAAFTDTRFGRSADLRCALEELSGRPVLTSIAAAEPLGPQNMADLLLIAPCTGNTLGKLACGITDTSVTMAAKSMLRVGKPVVLAISTNDGLAASFQNIGRLMNTKHIYFVPFGQDAPGAKPAGLQADFALAERALPAAMDGRQLQPVLCKSGQEPEKPV